MIGTYDDALASLLVHEGGYSNHPSDPGGPTKYGITIIDYRKYVKPGATAADVRAMKIDEAKAIYRSKYWDEMRCNDLPAGLDYAVFDFGVNSGNSRSAKYLQSILRVKVDGVIGDETIAAANRANVAKTITDLCDSRLAFLKGLKTWKVFGAGWGRRVAEVKAASLKMAKNYVPPPPDVKPIEPPAPTPWGKVFLDLLLGIFKRR